jgi:hypothetical protein
MRLLSKLMSIITMVCLGNNIASANSLTLPAIKCEMSDNISDEGTYSKKNIFHKDTPSIYLICSSDNVLKGQRIQLVWIANDTHGVAPNNYLIDQKSLPVNMDLNNRLIWTGKYTLPKPYHGWPLGKYHAYLYVDGHLIKNFPFSVT